MSVDELRGLSDQEIDRLYWQRQQEQREPELRAEERRRGSPDWESASYYDLLQRSIQRFRESRRPNDLRKAERLGVSDPEKLTTDALHWAVVSAEIRERRIRELAPAPLSTRGWWR